MLTNLKPSWYCNHHQKASPTLKPNAKTCSENAIVLTLKITQWKIISFPHIKTQLTQNFRKTFFVGNYHALFWIFKRNSIFKEIFIYLFSWFLYYCICTLFPCIAFTWFKILQKLLKCKYSKCTTVRSPFKWNLTILL